MFFKTIFEYIKSPAKYVLIILTFCSLLLLFPDGFLSWLGLLPFREQYHQYIGAFLLLSSCILLYNLLEKPVKYLIRGFKKGLKKRRLIKLLPNLPDYEKVIIRNMFKSEAYTMKFDLTSGKHAHLSLQNIIFQSSQLSIPGARGAVPIAYTLGPWTIEYLNNNKDY